MKRTFELLDHRIDKLDAKLEKFVDERDIHEQRAYYLSAVIDSLNHELMELRAEREHLLFTQMVPLPDDIKKDTIKRRCAGDWSDPMTTELPK